MVFDVLVSGRRLSDGTAYELKFSVDAPTEAAATASVEDYDWSDAATRCVQVERSEKG